MQNLNNPNLNSHKLNRKSRPIIDKTGDYMGAVSLHSDLDYVIRRRSFTEDTKLKQALSGFWTLFRIRDFQPHSFGMKFTNVSIEISGNAYIYFPANTFVEWNFKPGTYEYEAFTSFMPADKCFPQTPIVFPYDSPHDIHNYQVVADLLLNMREQNIGIISQPSYVGHKTKAFLDSYFTENISFDDMAKELKIPYSTMSSGFKSSYGVQPVAYRNILRTFEAMRLIKNNVSITQAGLQAGFGGITQYNQHFHDSFGVPPSAFQKL